MKKIFLFSIFSAILCLCNLAAIAQSPRLQLFEYFDNTSIPPFGAVANAHFDSLANANQSKVTFIKYHVAWGAQTGTDPMNLHNPIQAQDRVNTYTITGDPAAVQDGGDTAKGLFHGQPSTLKQSFITNRDAFLSPFTVKVSHALNAAHDSIFCTTIIKKTAASSGTLVAQVVVIEKLIHFSVAPGGSGDKDFRNVMKQMLPSSYGTPLPAMVVGDSVILNLNWGLANVYDTTQLAVVSFVQDTTTLEVRQAGYSAPHPQANDAAILAINSVPAFSCDSISAAVILQNSGSNVLNTCTINYQIDQATPMTVAWTGPLASSATTTVTLPKLYSGGYHTLKIFSSNPNGSPDPAHLNDTALTTFSIAAAATAIPFTEGFQNSFYPANWGIGNPNNDSTWVQENVGGFGISSKAERLGWYWMPATGNTDDLYAPPVDLSTNTVTVHCEFNLAYTDFDSTYHDTLQVRVSTDCGITWTTVYSKGSKTLATAPYTTNYFVPTASEWRRETINLTPFNGQSDVLVQFHGINGYGNNLYLDDIFIGVPPKNDAGINSISGITQFKCDTIKPVIVLHNNGTDTLKMCSINDKLDQAAPVVLPWTGNLAPDSSISVSLPAITAGGSHTLTVFTSNPNGVADASNFNDTVRTSFSHLGSKVTVPLTEGFQNAFTPLNWCLGSPAADATWMQDTVGGFGNSTKSASMNFPYSAFGQFDDLYTPPIDLSTSTDTINCEFNVAYSVYSGSPGVDYLYVKASTDCGTTWKNLYFKGGSNLASAPISGSQDFVPTSTQWKHIAINLTKYNGQSGLLLQFHAVGGGGNILYLDDINISVVTGIKSYDADNSFDIYPNPSAGNFKVYSDLMINKGTLEVCNLFGETVYKETIANTNEQEIHLENIPAGLYFLKIRDGEKTFTKKLVIQ